MNWRTKTLKECARVVGGATPKSGKAEYWDGSIAWVTPRDVADLGGKYISETPRTITDLGLRKCSAELLPANSVLLSSRAPIGHVAINTVPMATNQGFKSMIPGPDLDADFLYWWLVTHRRQIERMGNGATFKEVSKSTVENIEISLPILSDQKRIAAILDQATELRYLHKRAIMKIDRLSQSVFYEMFGDFESMPQKALADIADIERNAVNPSEIGVGVNYLGLENIQSGGSIINVQRINSGDLASAKFQFSREHILYGKLRPYLAKIALPDFEGICSTDILPLKPGTEINRAFLAYYLRSPSMVRYAALRSIGANLPRLSPQVLGQIKVPLPLRSKQNKFASIIGRIDTLRDFHEMALVKANGFYAALQQRAFRGKDL